ncbi:MAG: LPXTG cell wall anchor domain-containing protein [Cryobacterium sp.]|nr:LPXTG cell wall anchor domain-containing protein [Cryobacterium sp.]
MKNRPERAFLASALALTVAVATLLVPVQPAFAADPAGLDIQKGVSKAAVGPNETLQWTIQVGCSVITDHCVNAQLVDVIPPQFQVGGVAEINMAPDFLSVGHADLTVVGQTVTVDFKRPLPSPVGQVGIDNNDGTITITIPVTVRNDLQHTPAPIVVTNTATVTADNAPSESATADVELYVPLHVATTATKTFAPDDILGLAGTSTTVTVGGTNTSNSPVDTFTIQDPQVPAFGTGIFAETLEVASLGTVTWPASATHATVSVWDANTLDWVDGPEVEVGNPLELPGTVLTTDIRGVRITFTSPTPDMQTGQTAGFELATTLRADDSGTRSNTSTSTVSVGGVSATAPATDTLNLQAATRSILAEKSISPDQLATVEGETEDHRSGTVTLSATNTGSIPLAQMRILEPSDPTDQTSANPFHPDHEGGGLLFGGFDAVTWPAGADSASITYYYFDGDSDTQAAPVVGGSLPEPGNPAKRVTGFEVVFDGTEMVRDDHATVRFLIHANPDQVEPKVDYINTIEAHGIDVFGDPVDDDDTANVTVFGERIDVETQKTITTREMLAVPGQQTTVTLRAHMRPYPESTRSATEIIQYDPPLGTAPTPEWYNYFTPTQLVLTSIPQNATLTVQYLDDDDDWNDVAGLVDLEDGPLTLPISAAEDIHGLRLIWRSTTGFVPDQTLTANVAYQLRSTLLTGGSLPNADHPGIENCTSVTASNTVLNLDAEAESVPPCPLVILHEVPATGAPGEGDGGTWVGKSFGQELINTRSRAHTDVRLSWSTNGRTDVREATVTDSAVTGSVPNATAYDPKGMYDAFDLFRINGLTDSYLQYDRVAIEVYSLAADDWVTPAGISCTVTNPCTTFNGYTLSDIQRADTVGVRFIFTERPNRTDPAFPPGTGVAGAYGQNRNIDLVFQIRDTLRSDPTFPVVNGPEYNTDRNASESIVLNDVSLAAELFDTTVLRAHADDTIQLQDAELAVDVTKTWTGGPVPIVGDGITPRPTSRVVVSTVNETTGTTISELTIAEPDLPGGNSPFAAFDLSRFFSFSHPAGSAEIEVRVFASNGDLIVTTGRVAPATGATTAQNWSAVQLENATSFTVHWYGRMAENATGTVRVDLALRPTIRGSVAAPSAGFIHNDTRGTVRDLRFDVRCDPASPEYDVGLGCSPESPLFALEQLPDTASAQIELRPAGIGVTAGKTFSPATQAEGNRNPIQMRLTSTPTGSERVKQLTLTDDRATFWNAFDFVAKGTITLPTFTSLGGAAVLQVEVCTGGTFTDTMVGTTTPSLLGCEDAGRDGTWMGAGIWLTQSQLNGGAFLPLGITPAQVEGLRLTVKRSDDAQWENEHAPQIVINLSVQRREELRTGGAVPSSYTEFAAAPGESVKGRTTNTVGAHVLGVWNSTATASASTHYSFGHLTTRVQVSKLPVGIRPPGAVIPFTLTMLNTGQRPIENPVITDTLPLLPDDGLAMLIFNPDAPTEYTITVNGGTPSGAPVIPAGKYQGSVPDVLTITTTEDAIGPTEIEFRFPPGTVINPGQTVTVTIPLMFRPGLVHGTELENSFEIRGDREFEATDGCTAPSAHTATFTSARKGCSTATEITLALASALRAYIAVKALDTPGIDFPGSDHANSQYTGGTNEECRAAQIADGFSRPPCAPTTIPGQDSTWRLVIQNTGTTDVERLVVATRLPTTGDQTIVSHLIRTSQWIAQFNGAIEHQFGSDATVQVFYTTQLQPCGAVLQAPSNANACGSDPATGWAPLPPGGLSDPTIVTGLQFVVDFDSSNLFRRGQTTYVDIGTTTAASLAVFQGTAGENPLAVNSLSVSGISDSVTLPRIAALDYSRALLGLATGSVTLTKEITGPAAGFIPGFGANPGSVDFVGQLTCDLFGEVFTRDFTFTISGGVITPASIQFDRLPGGADCAVTETAASGQTGYTTSRVIVDPLADPPNLPNIELVNDYQLTQFEIRKGVTAPVGTVIPTGFTFAVTCSFLGLPITLDPTDASFTLDDEGVKIITGLPVNAECAVQETDNRGAGATVVDGGTVAPGSVTEDSATSTVTITGLQPQPGTGPSVNWAEFDNRYDVSGVVRVAKAFDGDAAAQFGSDPALGKTFTIHVVCVLAGTTQFDGDIELTAANGWEESIPAEVSPGALCTFTEPDLGGADAVVFSPADTGPPVDSTTGVITVPADTATATVTATNWFLTGAIDVTKLWTGDADAITKFGTDPSLLYEFTLICTRDGLEVNIPGGNTRDVNSTSPVASYTGIASGADCVLTETRSNGAYAWRVVDDNGDPVTDGVFAITVDPTSLTNDQTQAPLFVENEFLFAEVSVAKRIDLYRPDGGAVGPFEVELACTLDGRPIDPLEPALQVISDGDTVTWTELAAGADCVITETDRGGALATGFRINDLTGSLTARVNGDVATLAPLRPIGDVENNAEFINSYVLPVTGGSDSSWLLISGALLLFGGAAALLLVGVRRRHEVRTA